ncbi:MAG: universal stress protein [Mucilaginibacter sp.]|uniref:universal stress protein n=1 Tax=Mucilaginibacter sp. TaxID=1882438 RepID=UPI00262CC203|nr:universal stress protein [Mucilaginibacter sp.]MDB5005523.1 universal stress protein [Mucilaginibacter sp.]
MKKLLIATDFSSNARHAAEYGYLLAKQLKAGIFLCNTITIPVEIPMAGWATWPQDQGELLLEDSTEELKRLKAHLEHTDHSTSFRPPVDYLNEAGTVRQTVNEAVAKQKVDLIVAGSHDPDRLGTFLLGNHMHELIEFTIKPLLIIPNTAKFTPIKKIAFATDLENPENDLKHFYELIEFARRLDAEILLTHIYKNEDHLLNFEKGIEKFLLEISNKANYPQIFYRVIKHDKVEMGLDWLCEQGHIDMLAMVHRPHDFLDSILKGSHTKKMAKHIAIPLLVFPETK